MSLFERFAVLRLAVMDHLMDVVTFGLWTKVRGEVTWEVMKVKE